MNIEQIAKEAWSEVCKSSSVGESIAEPFLRRCLSKLAEQDVEPVAWQEFDGEGGYDYRSYEFNESFRDEYRKRNPGRTYTDWVEPLYTEAQYLAAQQRTAEACAKACENLPRKFRSEFSNVSSECAEAIRNGAWREHL